MKNKQCPICFSDLVVKDCAPCDDCGHLDDEIKHFKEGRHKYNVYNIYKGLKLQLCDFCDVDFGSYKSEFLGFDDNRRIRKENFEFVSSVEKPSIEKDKYCPECGSRLKFLRILRGLRELIEKETIANKK